jgi:hypothetical protein
MKTKFYAVTFLCAAAFGINKTNAQANQQLSNLTAPTSVNASLLPDKDVKRDLGNTNKGWRNLYLDTAIYFRGHRFIAFQRGSSIDNTIVGSEALNTNTTGYSNTSVGYHSMYLNTSGHENTAVGLNALYFNTSGYYNTAIGLNTLYENTTGIGNTATGNNALNANTTGAYNTAHGLQSLYSNQTGSYNTALGTFALYFNMGSQNTATGYDALVDNTAGFSNTATGYLAGYRTTTGNNNVFVGDSAGVSNTTGVYNTFVGGHAGTFTTGSFNTLIGEGAGSFTTGESNSFLGVAAGFGNGSGFNNVYIGDSSGYYGSLGKNNTIVGFQAGLHNLTDFNCFFGQQAGINNTNGSKNTYLGYHAANTGTTGSSNTIIGYGADVNDGTISNATAIGNFAVVDVSNHIHIGNASVTSIGGQVNWTAFSDERIKTNIKENVPGLAFINLLKPVTYHFDLGKQEAVTGRKISEEWNGKYDIQQIQFTGFLAQDVEAAAKKINYDFSGVDVPKSGKGLYGLRYSDFVVPLVKAVQELSTQNQNLQKQNDDLEQRVEKLESMMNISSSSLANQQTSLNAAVANLSQNFPNPFNNSTIINYSLPQQFSSAKIIITDKNGNALKQFDLSNNKGSVNVDASRFTSGTYQYSLYADGRLIATKQMIINK